MLLDKGAVVVIPLAAAVSPTLGTYTAGLRGGEEGSQDKWRDLKLKQKGCSERRAHKLFATEYMKVHDTYNTFVAAVICLDLVLYCIR